MTQILTPQEVLNLVRRNSGGYSLSVLESVQESLQAVIDATQNSLRVTLDPSCDVYTRIDALENIYVTAQWFQLISAVSGAITRPSAAKIVLDAWPEGVDALASGVDSFNRPSRQAVFTSGSAEILAGLAYNATTQDYTDISLSGTPAGGWPVAVIYTYRVPLLSFNYQYALLDEGVSVGAGESAYVYIAYASDSSGTDFTMTFDATLDYIAIKTTTTEIASPQASDFTGLWKNYKGATGQGVVSGGTTGQVLTKVDAIDFNTTWTSVGSSGYSIDLANASLEGSL